MNNIAITRTVPTMRTIPQIRQEYPELQLSERFLRSLVRDEKIRAVHIGVKTLVNIDSLFDYLNNGEGA